MNFLAKLFGSPATPKPAPSAPPSPPPAPREFFSNVFTWQYLEYNIQFPIKELAECGALGDANIVPYSYQSFLSSINPIIALLRKAEQTGTLECSCFHKPSSNTCLFVSAVPCSTPEAAGLLARHFDRPGQGYTALLDTVLQQRPSADFPYWSHLLITMVDGGLLLGAGAYVVSGTLGWKAYHHPKELSQS